MNMIERLESNVNWFIKVLEKKIKSELQIISNENDVIISIIDEKEIEIFDNESHSIYDGEIYDNIWNLMEIWWNNIGHSRRFYDILFKPE